MKTEQVDDCASGGNLWIAPILDCGLFLAFWGWVILELPPSPDVPPFLTFKVTGPVGRIGGRHQKGFSDETRDQPSATFGIGAGPRHSPLARSEMSVRKVRVIVDDGIHRRKCRRPHGRLP